MTAATATATVSGVLVIDLVEVARQNAWPGEHLMRRALSEIERAPRGAEVRIVIPEIAPFSFYVEGLQIDHVRITVEGTSAERVGQWVAMLRQQVAR